VEPAAQAGAILRKSRSSFRTAFLLLPRERRDGLAAIYAVCREMDDVADGKGPVRNRRAALDAWEAQVRRAIVEQEPGAVVHPAAKALALAARKFAIGAAPFRQLAAGLRSDLLPVRIKDVAQLREYCDRVAGAVGLACLPVFGVAEEVGRRYALLLGRGLQLTNVLRDLASDAQRNRIYVPADERAAFGCGDEGWLEGRPGEGFGDLLTFQTARARAFLDQAAEERKRLPRSDRRALRPADAMRRTYASLLCRVENAGVSLFRERPRVSRAAALWAAARAMAG